MHSPFALLLSVVVFSGLLNAQSTPGSSQNSVTDYAPNTNVECPDFSTTSLIRVFTPQNQSLHPQETEYIKTRTTSVLPGEWKAWLGDGSSLGYNLSAFEGKFPLVGFAVPGGGLRAAQYAAGCLSGLDARNESAKAAGTGGLLQVASYISGLSGGSWVTASLLFNNWPTIKDLVYGNGQDLGGWLLDLDLVAPDGADPFSKANQAFFGSILWSVVSKAYKGIDTSLTDPWSRMISYHFLNQTNRNNFFTNDSAHGAGQLWSDVPLIPAYQQYQIPLPIIVADSRPSGSNLTTVLPLTSTVYEINPFEFGSFDPNLSAMMNLTYVGTSLSNGRAVNGSACVTGFDQTGFMIGTSASLFNQILDGVRNKIAQFSDNDSSSLLYVLARQLRSVRTRANDVANWPNPFNGIKPETFQDSNSTWLELIDGSSNQENVPFNPLFVKSRAVDVIVTLEGSSDDPVNLWPNGTALIFTAQRQSRILLPSHQQFPPIPQTADAFIETGVNARPTFFGCDPSQNPPEYPLVIYLPNAPPINGDDPVTNTPTFTLTYTNKHTRLFLDQVHNNTISGFTPNANTPDPNWGVCLQCAAIDRARLKLAPVVSRSAICTKCFQQYCFDPQNPPSKQELPNRKLTFVDPDPQGLSKVEGFLGENRFRLVGGLFGLAVFLGLLVALLIWLRKRKERQRAQYKRVSDFHDDDTQWTQHTDSTVWSSYELPKYGGSHVST